MINQKPFVSSLDNLSGQYFSTVSTDALLLSAAGIVNDWPRFAGHLSQYERQMEYRHYDDSWGPLNGVVMNHQATKQTFYEETNTHWMLFEFYLEAQAFLKRNRLYFLKVNRKKVSGQFWPTIVPAWIRNWIIAHPGKDSFLQSI